MGNYIKFWLAKMIAEFIPLFVIVGAVGLALVFLVVHDKFKRMFRRGTSSKGSDTRHDH